MTPIDHIADRLQFIAAAIPDGYASTAHQAAARLTDMHTAGQHMASLINRILAHQIVTPGELSDAVVEWENAL